MKNLVLFWGWSHDENSYQHLIDSAPVGWKVFSIAYPKLIPNGDLKDLDQAVLQTLKENHLEKVYLMGHSLGGALAIHFAAFHPELVEKLIIIDSEGIPCNRPAVELIKNILTPCPNSNEKASSGPRTFLNILKHPILYGKLGKFAYGCDVSDLASKVKIPTLILWGQKDRIAPLSCGQEFHQLIKNSILKVFPNEGHDWILHSPQFFWENIK